MKTEPGENSDPSQSGRQASAALSTALRNNPRLSNWSEATLLALPKIASKVLCPRGQALPVGSAHDRSLYLLHQGVFEMRVMAANGHAQALRYLHPGGWVGLIAAFSPQLPGENQALVAYTDAVLWRLPLTALRPIMAKDPAVASTLLAALAGTALSLTDEVCACSLLTADGRVARCLLSAAVDPLFHPMLSKPGASPMRITQAEIANMLGLSRQSVGTALRALELAGLIRMGRQKIEILSAPGLRDAIRQDDPLAT